MRELSFRGKRESENSPFVENENPRILVLWKTRIPIYFFFFLSENSRFVENGNWNLVLWKTRIGDFFFLSENSRFVENQNRRIFFLSENSRFVENGNGRILVLWKTRIEKKKIFREFSFCGKREMENSRFVKNQNWRIF